MTTSSPNTLKRIAIIGASGYTGAELIRLLLDHPHVKITALTGDSQAGKPIGEIYPHLACVDLPDVVTLDAVDFSAVDIVFCCLPHGTTQEVIAGLPPHLLVIDLSADFRLANTDTYAQWYGHPHLSPDLQKEAVYGLTEHNRDAIKKAQLIACPGCYPTSALLPLIPLLRTGMIESSPIIIDAKSGMTGAGRSAKQASLFAEIDGGISAYSIGKHRHRPEIEQELSKLSNEDIQVSFTPHLIPMNRGILSTIYVRTRNSIDSLVDTLHQAYAHEPFIHVMTDSPPTTHQVRGSNHCRIGVYADSTSEQAIIVSVIDNLVKGASGQAVQNMNVRMGWEETTGLTSGALFP